MMNYSYIARFLFVLLVLFCGSSGSAEAATLRLSPETGVYTVAKPFVVQILLNTEGKSVNAADGKLTFNPRELQVTSVSRATSIFNLWTEEPTFSNTGGTVSFGGGSPSGYKGTVGSILTIHFKPLGAGNPKIQFTSGSILAADGLGTNILSAMTGGTYTVSAPSDNPEPEYIAPANTPKVPVVTSLSHPDQNAWYTEKNVKLSWDIPNGVTGIRTLLDDVPTTIPTIVYDTLITEKIIEEVAEGTSYFHIQFKNSEGWGKIAHFKINIDSEAPVAVSIAVQEPDVDDDSVLSLVFNSGDISPIVRYNIQLDGGDPIIFDDVEGTKRYSFETLNPGYHTAIVEAFDSAGNSTIGTLSFTLEALEKPTFIDYPTRINTEVIPAIKGKTIPNVYIAVNVKRASDGLIINTVEGDNSSDPFTVRSNEQGEFTYVPDTAFERGVYSITAIAKDSRGRMSETSDEIKIIVEAPGYVVIGSFIINALSVIVPLSALVLVLIFGSWYLWHKLSVWKRRVRKETLEAENSLTREINTIIKNLDAKIATLKESQKGKLTKGELDLVEGIEGDLKGARTRIGKEIEDIENTIA